MPNITEMSNNSSDTPAKNRLCPQGGFASFRNIIVRNQPVNERRFRRRALSSAVEHYLNTIKMAIISSFSNLYPALIYISRG